MMNPAENSGSFHYCQITPTISFVDILSPKYVDRIHKDTRPSSSPELSAVRQFTTDSPL